MAFAYHPRESPDPVKLIIMDFRLRGNDKRVRE
jgi:hypothetical protein